MKNGPARRTFLKTVGLAGGLAHDLAARSPAGRAAPRERFGYPRTFSGPQLAMLAFPLGGIGAGSISLGGRGQLRDWEIFNRPDKGNSPAYAFAAIRALPAGSKPFASVLEARLLPPYEGQMGLGFRNAPGLPRLASAIFTGEFPIARIDFRDPDLPVRMRLEAFTPFIPHEADDSGLPVAVLRYFVKNPGTGPASVSVVLAIDNPVAEQGRSNEYRKGGNLEGLLMRNPLLDPSHPLAGSFVLAILNAGAGRLTYLRGWAGKGWWAAPLQFWEDFTSDGELGPESAVHDSVGSLCLAREIPPGSEADYTFLLSWHFPNRTPERCGWKAPKGEERALIGNHCCARFRDAWEAAEYLASRLPDLEARTRKFVEAVRTSTLPAAVRDAAMSNLSTLVSPTCFRTADGVFHGFEGSNNQGGCCFGNCTHVWNYEAATAYLFPSLSRSRRETAFLNCTDDGGRMDFRQLLPHGKERFGMVAADGQMGQIIKLYFDWKLSADTDWLRRLWPAAKRALEFAWVEGGWDADRDGVLEGVQHNTYDVEFFGPNPLCGVWYLGALRAAEEMARAVGDDRSAVEYRRLFEKGGKWIDRNLFNGEYYIQQIRGGASEKIAGGLTAGMGAADTENPDFQLGEGCLVDQLAGQYFADIAGLGDLLDPAHIRKTLQSIYRYNYKRNLYRHESVQRVYALNDEAALVICDYGKGKRPEIPFPYFAEVMTGFEYSAAILMLFRGMLAEGVELIGNIRRRYDGIRRNPWDEAECGHHYARAMASWAAIPALSGFRYDAPGQRLTVQPPGGRTRFVSFWSTGTGWGTFIEKSRPGELKFLLHVDAGLLAIRTLSLAPVAGARVSGVALAGKESRHSLQAGAKSASIRFEETVVVRKDEELALRVGSAPRG